MPITFLDEEEDIKPIVPPTKRKITFLDEEDDEVTQPATSFIPYQYDKSRFRPKAKTPKEKEVGTLEGIANAARNAFDSSRQAMDVVGGVTPEEAKNISKIEYDKQSRKLAPGYDEYQKAEGMDAVWAFAKNPIEVTSNIIAEGLAGSLPALGAGLAAGGAGALIGAPTGIGAPIGFTAGQIAGTFAGSLATEYGGKILEEMQNEGMDIQDPESIQKFFSNQTLVDAAKDKALKRGVPIAAFDAISAGIGGKLGRVIGKQFVTKTGEAAAELGVQAGLGGAGAVVGPLAAGEAPEGKEVFGEIIGEAGPGAAEIITGRMADRAARVKAEEDAKIKAAAELSTNLEENSAPLTAAAVKSTTATTIEQDKLAAQLEEQLDAEELVAVKEPTAAPPTAIPTKDDYVARYSAIAQVAPEELTRAEQSFTSELATADTKEKRTNAQNALDAIKEVKATRVVAPEVKPTKAGKLPTDVLPVETPGATYGREEGIYDVFSGIRRKPLDITQPAEPTAQPTPTDATQEIIQPEGVREEPQDGTQVGQTKEAIVSDSLQPPARGEEEGQVIFGLRSVADNTATREQISALSEAGLVDIVKGKPVINEDGAAILAQPAAPAIVEQEPVTTPALEEAVTPAPTIAEPAPVEPITPELKVGKPISVQDAIQLVAGKTEKPGGVNPATWLKENDSLELRSVSLSEITPNQEGKKYDGTVNLERAIKYSKIPSDTMPPIILVEKKRNDDGLLNVLDGGHRVSAARMRGDNSILAIVRKKPFRVVTPTLEAASPPAPVTEQAAPAEAPAPEVAPIQRDATKPEQMTTSEAIERVYPPNKNTSNAPDSGTADLNGMVAKKSGGGWTYQTDLRGQPATLRVTDPKTAARLDHQLIVKQAATNLQPVSADVVESYNIPLPDGYTKQGELYVYQSTPAVSKAPAPEVGDIIAVDRKNNTEFALVKGLLPERPDMFSIGIRLIGSNQPFESGGYGHNTNKDSVMKRFFEKERRSLQDIEIKNQYFQNILNEEEGRVSAVEAKESEKKQQEQEKQRQFNEEKVAYEDAISQVKIPTGKSETMRFTAPDGSDQAFESKRYGDVGIRKVTSGKNALYNVDHWHSGLRIMQFNSLSEAKKFTQAIIASGADISKKDIQESELEKLRPIARYFRSGEVVPSIPSQPAAPTPAVSETITKPAPVENVVGKKVTGSMGALPQKATQAREALQGYTPIFKIGDFYEFIGEEAGLSGSSIVGTGKSARSSLPYHQVSKLQEIANKTGKPIAIIANTKVAEVITPEVSETPAPAQPAGIAVGNRVKLGKSPQTYTIEEVIPQTANDKKFGEQYYNVKNEKTGETQVVEKNDMKPVSSRRRKMASEPEPLPEGDRYGQVKLNKRIQRYFGGKIPDKVYVVDNTDNKEYQYKAAYYPDLGILVVNNAYVRKGENVGDIIAHELGHYAFGDKKFKEAFDNFYNSLSPEDKAKIDNIIEDSYNEETEESKIEERNVIAFTAYTIVNPQRRSLWNAVLDALKEFANKVFGKNFQMSDPNRTALAMLATAKKRFAAGEEIVREGEAEGPRRMAVEAEPRTEQVAGRTDRGTDIITTPVGIIKQTNEVLRKNFFDGTTVSDEATKNAWLYISRLLDIESGNANELAGQINDTVDVETNSDSRMGASLFSVSLANYAAKLAALGDSTMLSFLVRRINRMPVDKYAGGRSEAGEALRGAREYDIDGYGALQVEQKAKRDRTAAEIFARANPTEQQVKDVSDAIDAADNATIGTPEEVASDVEEIEKRTKRNITKKLETLLKKGSLKEMIASIKNTPLEEQQAPGWIEKVIKGYLEQAGLTGDAATTAAKLYDSILTERFVAAKQKAFEETLKRSAPWNNYLSRNSRMAKDSLKKIQVAIRTGVLDPSQTIESVIAKENGWDGFTKEQFEKIVQLDNIINNPDNDDVTRREAMSELNKVIVDAKLPVRFKDALGAYYVGNALMGIPTVTVNIASPIGFTVRNLITDIGRYAFTDPARIPIAFESFLDSMRSWYDQTSYAFKNQIYLNDVVEYLQGQNVLRELFDKGKKQWANGEYAAGFVNMAVGMTQITGRVLSSLDQGAIAMLENQNITRYAMEALAGNTKGRVPKDKLKEFANMVLHTKRRVIAESIASGMPRDRAGVLADLAVKSEVIAALATTKAGPASVLDAAINDALLSVGRNKAITIKGAEDENINLSDEGMLSYLPISFLQTIASGAARQGSAMQIFSKMLYGFALVPARVFHNVAWFSPYGFLRLGVDAYKKSKGQDSPYAMSLQTDAQFKQRLTEAIAGSIVMLGLAALRAGSSDDEDDKQFKIVITGNGPSATTDRQYYDSWNKKWKPYSIHIVVGDTIIPINIGRGGEALFFPIMLAGAMDDWEIKKKQNDTKKEPEDLSAMASMLGSSFFALAQRGPYAAFTKPLFDASKDGRVTEELASQAGYFGKTFIPFLGTSVARNITDFINDPVDRSSVEGAIYANTPIVGPWMGAKALNALGQPVRADDWGDKLYKLGVPVVFSFPKDTPMNELNELILKQGSGPTFPTRTNAQKRFGDILTDKEFETYVREYGKVMSDRMFKNRTKLARMKPSDYDDELEKYARGYSAGDFKIKGASDAAVQVVKRMRQ